MRTFLFGLIFAIFALGCLGSSIGIAIYARKFAVPDAPVSPMTPGPVGIPSVVPIVIPVASPMGL